MVAPNCNILLFQPYLSDAGGGGDGVEEVLAGGRGTELHVELRLVRRHGHVQMSLPHLDKIYSRHKN